jgi:hypothetical protein
MVQLFLFWEDLLAIIIINNMSTYSINTSNLIHSIMDIYGWKDIWSTVQYVYYNFLVVVICLKFYVGHPDTELDPDQGH